MDENTAKIAQGLRYCVKAYQAKHSKFEFDEDTTMIYIRLLSDLDGDAVLGACLDHISKSSWFPGVDELRKRAIKISKGTKKEITALEAWGMALKSYNFVGAKEEMSPLIEKTVESLGGWTRLGRSTNTTADRARFVEAYNSFLDRDLDSAVTLPIVNDLKKAMDAKQLGTGTEKEVKSLVEKFTE